VATMVRMEAVRSPPRSSQVNSQLRASCAARHNRNYAELLVMRRARAPGRRGSAFPVEERPAADLTRSAYSRAALDRALRAEGSDTLSRDSSGRHTFG
jgi:hypothetical protein